MIIIINTKITDLRLLLSVADNKVKKIHIFKKVRFLTSVTFNFFQILMSFARIYFVAR